MTINIISGGRIFVALIAMLCASATPAFAQDRIFDSHVHLWDGEKSLGEYEAQIKASGLDATAFGGMWFGGPNQAAEGKIEETRAANNALIALASKYPKLLPVGTVHPYDGKAALAEMERISRLGVKVMKIHPHTQGFDAADPRVLALVRRAGEVGIIVLFDNASIVPDDNEKLFNLALQSPKTRFIFAHMGGLSFRFWNVLHLIRTAEKLYANNIYFDISATVTLAADSPIEDEFIWTIRNVGTENVLLGSDYPQFSLKQNLDALDRLNLTKNEKDAIRFDNARRLFDLKGY
jgi:hypothetical protein